MSWIENAHAGKVYVLYGKKNFFYENYFDV